MANILASGVNYTVIQVNGQRIVGPPDIFLDMEPSEKCEVFISNIPTHLMECDLMPIVSCFGRVFQMRLMMKITGENRGFCYVMYMCERDARNAIKNLNRTIVLGHKINVSVSKNMRHIILGGINPTIPEDVVLQGLQMYIEPNNVSFLTRFNRKCILMEFANHREAALAKRALSIHAKEFGKGVYFKWYN